MENCKQGRGHGGITSHVEEGIWPVEGGDASPIVRNRVFHRIAWPLSNYMPHVESSINLKVIDGACIMFEKVMNWTDRSGPVCLKFQAVVVCQDARLMCGAWFDEQLTDRQSVPGIAVDNLKNRSGVP